MKATEGTISCNDAVTGHFWSKGVTLEGLSNCLSTTTAYATSKFAISDDLTSGYTEKFQIDTTLEFGDVRGGEDTLANIGHDDFR
jgi:hypothetical protein